MEQIVDEGRTGVLFAPGDAIDLALKTRQLHSDCSALAKMRRAARAEFERCFHSAANHEALMAVYERCLPWAPALNPANDHFGSVSRARPDQEFPMPDAGSMVYPVELSEASATPACLPKSWISTPCMLGAWIRI